jgi:hypothetical protein
MRMNLLPRVTEYTRESVCREFDEFGPDASVRQIVLELEQHNPHILDMARKCARDLQDSDQVLLALVMFYRLLVFQAIADGYPAATHSALPPSPLPRVTDRTRDVITAEIDAIGTSAFTTRYTRHLEQENPELLLMAHDFASRHPDYLGLMEGVLLMWASLVTQSRADRSQLH